MTATLAFVIILVFLALVFDYINGFHDAANSIATVVSTRVLSPGLAVIWAAFFNFIAFAVFGTRVAKSIGDGVRMDLISADLRLYVLLAALLGAIIWNLITWYLGCRRPVRMRCSVVMPAQASLRTAASVDCSKPKFGFAR